MSADVTILIPAYEAEEFIDQTLYFARGQTYGEIEIVVSVDHSADATFERVTDHARQDRRIRAYQQVERLGWAGNVNFLLDQVRTPYCFIYFHDDVIVPHYIERLLPTLLSNPEAALAHCDVRYIGAVQSVLPARANIRPRFERLMQFMLAPDRGAPLRGIMRRAIMGELRLPVDGRQSLYANETFLFEAAASGHLAAHNEILYVNWANRPQGLMAQWEAIGHEEALAGVQSLLARAHALVERAASSDYERAALQFACFLWLKRFVDDAERRSGARIYNRPEDLLPAFEHDHWPIALDTLAPDIATWARERWTLAEVDLSARLTHKAA
ncbi:MAG: hypothetical protein DCF16_05225 [Alphaproteobacteria bacterium]|nr:MAG: hypothetical protein DCF16_05225 [Alphaproteobacteria bacterium]